MSIRWLPLYDRFRSLNAPPTMSIIRHVRRIEVKMRLFGLMPHKKHVLVLLPLIALVLTSCERNSTPSNLPANSNLSATEGDTSKAFHIRYKLIPIINGGVTLPYVIDSQTGRVWREAIDSEHNALVFVSLDYRNMEGALSKVPNETATTDFVSLKNSLMTDLTRTIKERNIWDDLLEQAKAGNSIKNFEGWDTNGNPVYANDAIQASEKVIDAIKQNIEKCKQVVDHKTQLIQQLPDRTP